MRLDEFDFFLPEEQIAQTPLTERSASRMLVVDRASAGYEDRMFTDLPGLLRSGDVLVVNNTRVFPARLYGRSETGAAVEVFLVSETADGTWETLARPARRLKPGKSITFGQRLSATVLEKRNDGKLLVRFDAAGDFAEIVDEIGTTPLPPYIHRDKTAVDTDRERYQTVFASDRGAIAAPTAGLHFTPEVLNTLVEKGVEIVELTLHVGYGTFEPVRVDDIGEHRVSSENYSIQPAAADSLNRASSEGRRIVAVGTTSTRALEANVADHGAFTPGRHSASLTIVPGYEFRAVSAILTNFHLPKSSLLIMISTFAGHELIMSAYEHAVASGYRFYSYGDCMFIS